jgi:hypothetical protein
VRQLDECVDSVTNDTLGRTAMLDTSRQCTFTTLLVVLFVLDLGERVDVLAVPFVSWYAASTGVWLHDEAMAFELSHLGTDSGG